LEGFVKVQLATRLDGGLRQRLRIYAAVTGRTVEDVVSAALDGYLPPTSDMVRGADGTPREDALLEEQPEVA
jgi:plasmid stability protein